MHCVMDRSKFLSALIVLMVTTSLSAQNTDVLNVRTYTLGNGMEVWINEDHSSPKAYGAIVVKAGARDCPGTGIAHYFEHIMFKGTSEFGTINYSKEKSVLDSIAVMYDKLAETSDEKEREKLQLIINRLNIQASKYAIPNEFDALVTETGASNLNAYTNYDETVYHSDFIPEYFPQWAKLNADRLSDPVFRLFQSELETVYEEKNMYEDDMMRSLMDKVRAEFFKGTPYEIPVIGTTEYLKNPQLSRMKEFFDQYYIADNMCLILSGDLQTDAVLPVLEQTFGRIRTGASVAHPEVKPQDFNGEKRLEMVADIPLVKMSAFCYSLPAFSEPDNTKLEFLSYLMNNPEGTGLLDKLVIENKVIDAELMVDSYNGAGMGILYVIPKLVGQSTASAEEMLMTTIDDIKNGRIDESLFRSCLLSYRKSFSANLENLEQRVRAMASVSSAGLRWEEYLNNINSLDKLTVQDISDIAVKYLDGNCLHLIKKSGKTNKEHLSKPPYEKVVPECRDSVSAYAYEMRNSLSGITPEIQDVDFNKACEVIQVSDNMVLYANRNPVNDVFNLTFRFNTGIIDNPALGRLASYVSLLGTKDLDYNDFYGKLQELGGSIFFDAATDYFSFKVTGLDRNLKETVALAADVFTKLKGNRKALSSVKSDEKASMAIVRRDLSSIANALFYKVACGDDSPILADKGEFSDKFLMDLYSKVISSSCDVLYSGSAAAAEVLPLLSGLSEMVTNKIERPSEYPLVEYDRPAVYFIDKPDASQALIHAYVPLEDLTDRETRAIARLFNLYLGEGMTSIMFQEIREFRSMAYATGSQIVLPSWVNRSGHKAFLILNVGTQCDKAVEAMQVIDTLLHHTPMQENKLTTKKKESLNNAYNSYPGFREIGKYISANKFNGNENDVSRLEAEIVAGVSLEDMKAFHKKYIADKPIIWCVVGSASRIGMDNLSSLGPVTVLKAGDVLPNR